MYSKLKNLALYGADPIRKQRLPYGRHFIDEEDIKTVVEVLKSDWITTGPYVSKFEQEFANYTGAKFSVAVNSGTAALHAAMYAIGIEPGDEVVVPAMTFAATANAVVYQGGIPVFVDVDPDTLLIDESKIEEKITNKTKAIIAVDYAGHPCDYDSLIELASKYDLILVADACHSLGGRYKGQQIGSIADLNVFSFHPVKHITTGEGGMITTNNPDFAYRMKIFRNHGINKEYREREEAGSWFYEMLDIGYNYRISDFQCALGVSQLKKLNGWIKRRQEIAKIYNEAFKEIPYITPLAVKDGISHAYHLFVVKLNLQKIKATKNEIFKALKAEGIGVNVHYIPVHLHPFYIKNYGTYRGLCPIAEASYEEILSLPIFPAMTEEDINDVIQAIEKVIYAYT